MDDIYEYIINFVDEGDIINMLSTNKKFYSEKILLRVMNRRFPFLSKFKTKDENWRQFYIKMLFSIINLKYLGIPYISHQKFNPYKIFSKRKFNYALFLKYSIEIKDKNIMNLMIGKTSKFHLAFKSAVKMKDYDIINELVNKNVNKKELLYYTFPEAVRTGDIDLTNFFLNKGVKNFNGGLIGAVKGKNIEMVKYMINKGADNFSDALQIALKLNCVHIINLLLEKDFSQNFTNRYLEAAAEGGNIEIVKLMISKGANNFDSAIKSALKKDNFDIVNFLLEKDNLNFTYILEYVIKNGNIRLVNLLMKNVAINNEHLFKAVKYGHLKILKLLLKYKNPYDLFTMMLIACKYGRLKIVKFLYEKYDIKEVASIYVQYATNMGHVNIIKYFIEKGFKNYEEILYYGCMNFDIIKLMIEKGAKNFEEILNNSTLEKKEFLLAIKKSFLNKNDNSL